MEATGEANEIVVENVASEKIGTYESYQSTSVEGTIVEESRTVTYESIQEITTTDNQSSENNSHHQIVTEEICNLEATSDTEKKAEDNIGETIEQVNHTVEDVTEKNKISEVAEVVNEVKNDTEEVVDNVTGDILAEKEQQENITSDEQPAREENAKSTEYASEYMLENQAANVYMPEQESVVAYSTELISDDSQDKDAAVEQESGQQSSGIIEEVAQIGEDNIDPQCKEGHDEENETLPSAEQTIKIQLSEQDDTTQESIKIEVANNIEKYDNVSEVDNQSVGDNHSVGVSSESVAEQSVVEDEAVEDRIEIEEVHDIKEETKSMENHPAVEETQELEPVDEPLEQEEVIDENDGFIENIEVVNVPTTSLENISPHSYGLPEGVEVTEIQEEYTVVEDTNSLHISATQQGEATNSDDALVLLQDYENADDSNLMQISDDQHEVYLTELRSEAESRQSTSSQSSDTKPRRGRKPTFDLPMHVLGHDISKPVESVPNGRALPKPRLGVKVPYRNLTSQIVSKAEIEKEIMERVRVKQEQASARSDVLFARKLTQRLARKIAPSPNHPKRVLSVTKSEALPQTKKSGAPATEGSKEDDAQAQDSSKIHNDSDLLAILEGEGEEMPVLPKEVPQPAVDETNLKMLEREIALQQLQELPNQAPKERIFKGRHTKAPLLTAEASASEKTKSTEKSSGAKETSTSTAQNPGAKQRTEQPARALADKENTSKQPASKETSLVSPKKDPTRIDLSSSPTKQPVEIEPQVKVNMVLKTYSRKRKTVELPEPFPESPVAKKPMLTESEIKIEKADPAVPPDAYITKSSRVIKRKVIWDPDEIPVRSPKPARTESQSPKASPVRPAKSADKSSEKVVEKKPTTEKVVKEKPPEKKAVEKSVVKKTVNEKSASPEKKPPKTDSPKIGKTPIKSKKLRSEVDKLLMDEGAVKMLYDLKNTDDIAPPLKKKKDVYSVERAHKELLKKANEIKTDLEQNTSNESPKSLRKKENFVPSPVKPAQITGGTERKMSKDSTRSSLHTPPGSPPYSFPLSQSSMLVRRRSSSSISSSEEVSTDDSAKISKKKSDGSSDTPRPKKAKKREDLKEAEEPEKPSKESTAKPTAAENKLNQFKSFTVKKSSKHVTIDLNYTNEKCFCTVQVLEELTAALKKFAKDRDCNVVSITSSSKAFCLGLDYASLISDKEDVRKKDATELAGRVRDFLLCLLSFPKVLVAGIQGDCVGLGVTMLPLFDMVIASDTATFSTLYASIGCVAEAGFLLSSPHLTNHGLAAELLFTTQKLTADDAFRRGLISRLCWPEKYNETLKNIVMSVAKGTKQSLEATKKQLRRHVVQTTEAAINAESKLLIEHWTSAECQKNFAKLSEEGN